MEELDFDGDRERGRGMEDRFAHRLVINQPDRDNRKLGILIDAVNRDDDLYALWTAVNVNAMDRLGMTDHGPVHVKIVMNLAVKLLRLLVDHGVAPGVVRDYDMDPDDAQVVVAMAALLHDVGMSVHRADHEGYSLFIAQQKLNELLPLVYEGPAITIMRSEILHGIIAHRAGGRPLTIEAGVVRIADALDMAKGRSRIPFRHGSVSIHSVSAAAIEGIRIEPGEQKPVRLVVEMCNSAGVFQLDQLFREKLAGSGLEPYVELEAEIKGETEKRLVQAFRL